MYATLVGESNTRTPDPRFALYPYPAGCSGHRLAAAILGMGRRAYLGSFRRVNLVVGEWSTEAAREAAARVRDSRLVLLGSRVCGAFRVPFRPFAAFEVSWGRRALVLPHPSGRCRLWNDPDNIARARAAVAEFVPEVGQLLGRCGGGR